MKSILAIVKENKSVSKKKAVKKLKPIKIVVVQKVETMYVKVYARTDEEAIKLARKWYENKSECSDQNIVHDKDNYPMEYFGPITYGYARDVVGVPLNEDSKII